MDRYAVVGNPVAQSRSPEIHRMFAEQSGASLSYDRILSNVEEFGACITDFFRSGGLGLNVTLPFKRQAHDLAAQLDDAAREAGAVNTLMQSPDGLWGGNTDGTGLVRDLTGNQGVELAGQRVLMLGAGGAVRGVIGSLLGADVAEIVIVNRTHHRAEELAVRWSDPRVRAEQSQRCVDSFELVINGTSASLDDQVPQIDESVVGTRCLCYDMAYGAHETAFMEWARTRGASVADGLGMLVEQAAESFYIWRGVRPRTSQVLQALRAMS